MDLISNLTSFIAGFFSRKLFFNSTNSFRIGHGWDIHRLHRLDEDDIVEEEVENGEVFVSKRGKPLILGGIEISQNFSVESHSDGDALLHSIADAILGVCGLPDIGELFQDTDPQWKDSDSEMILVNVIQMAADIGWSVCSIDATIILERPKLGILKDDIIKNINRMLKKCKAHDSHFNVKARTYEMLDSVGQGKAVICEAVVLMTRK